MEMRRITIKFAQIMKKLLIRKSNSVSNRWATFSDAIAFVVRAGTMKNDGKHINLKSCIMRRPFCLKSASTFRKMKNVFPVKERTHKSDRKMTSKNNSVTRCRLNSAIDTQLMKMLKRKHVQNHIF
jgi:hypothetical protein